MTLLYILGGVAILLIVLAIVAPKSARVERNVVVNVSPQAAFQQLKSWKVFVDWSPWTEQDPNLDFGFKGRDGEVGSQYWWKGNKKVGEGEMEIVKLDPHETILMELRFLKPFKATNAAWFKVSPEGDGARVSWGFEAEFKLPLNIFMLFMSLDKSVGKDFERGLNRFKNIVESAA